MNPFTKEKTYPIMGYVNELENKVRKLQWQLTCHRLGSFSTGMVAGAALLVILQRILQHVFK